MSYEIPVSHGNGPRHLKLLDNPLLGIGARSHYVPSLYSPETSKVL